MEGTQRKDPQMPATTAEATAISTAAEWARGGITKWTAYGTIFELVDRRRLTLTTAVKILGDVAGIRPEVVRMRRHDWLAMKGAK